MVKPNENQTARPAYLFEDMLQAVLAEMPEDQRELVALAHSAQKAPKSLSSRSMELVLNSATSTVKRENKNTQVDPREGLTPGTYGVDCEVRIVGTVKVGEDYDQRIAAKADPWGLLAAALSKLNGVTVESLVREHLDHLDDQDEAAKAVKSSANRAVERIKGATVTRCKGKVTSNIGVYLRND